MVVVDNGSCDASVDVVEREFPAARVVRNENRGFAHGNNRGFETVDAPFVLFLNPDTEIRTGTFDMLLRYLCENPSIGLLGCRQVTGDGDLVLYDSALPESAALSAGGTGLRTFSSPRLLDGRA